jgi:glycosyltransferase involved in cell wall biosynthesis
MGRSSSAAQVKILYVVTAYDRTAGEGITPWLVETIRRLADRGVSVEVLAPSYRGLRSGVVGDVRVHRFRYAPSFWETLTHDQTAPDRVREKPVTLGLLPGFMAGAATSAARLARAGGFDVVHVHWPLPMVVPGWAARWAASIPLVCSFHGVEMTFARAAPVPFLVPFLRRAIRTADAVTANSTYTASLIRDLYTRPVDIIPFGATTPVPSEVPPLEPGGPLRLLFVGRLVERKGVHYLLEAVAAAREHVQLTLDIVGQGPDRERLENQSDALDLEDVVRFHGFVSDADLARHYAHSHVFVLPAAPDAKGDVEGLGVVLIEALSYGRAVIASAAGGITDIVKDDRSGVLVPPGDIPALADAITALARDRSRLQRLGREGREFVRRHFGWSGVIDRLAGLYQRLIDAQSGKTIGRTHA